MSTWVAIFVLVAWCLFWIIRDDRRTRRDLKISGPRVAREGGDSPRLSRSGEDAPSGRSHFDVDPEIYGGDLP